MMTLLDQWQERHNRKALD